MWMSLFSGTVSTSEPIRQHQKVPYRTAPSLLVCALSHPLVAFPGISELLCGSHGEFFMVFDWSIGTLSDVVHRFFFGHALSGRLGRALG